MQHSFIIRTSLCKQIYQLQIKQCSGLRLQEYYRLSYPPFFSNERSSSSFAGDKILKCTKWFVFLMTAFLFIAPGVIEIVSSLPSH